MFSLLGSLKKSLLTLPDFNFSSFKPEEELPYLDTLVEEKQAILEKLLSNLSIEHFPTFILYATQNISLGKQANSIHPFNTFEFFLSTTERVEKTKKIYHKTGIALGFEHFKSQSIKGFVSFLKQRHDKNELLPNLESFCAKTKKEITLLESYIKEENFEKFVEEVLINF